MSEAINQGDVHVSIDENNIGHITFGHPLSNSLPGRVLQKPLQLQQMHPMQVLKLLTVQQVHTI